MCCTKSCVILQQSCGQTTIAFRYHWARTLFYNLEGRQEIVDIFAISYCY